MVLGLGDRGMHYGTPHTATLAAMAQELVVPGIHVLPSPTEEAMDDPEALAVFAEKNAGQGYAFVVYAPGGNPGLADMGPNLGKQSAGRWPGPRWRGGWGAGDNPSILSGLSPCLIPHCCAPTWPPPPNT
jgi:hypothetical protein